MKQEIKTTQTDSKEGLHTQPDKIKLWVTGSGKRTNQTENELLLRTDDATLHFKKDSEFGMLAHALVDSYNERKALLDENKNLKKYLRKIMNAPSVSIANNIETIKNEINSLLQ